MFFFNTPKPASFARIRMQIISRWLLKKGKNSSVIALTSRFVGEGVSTVTRGLARSFGVTKSGKILLLEVSPKRSRKNRLLDVAELEDFSDLSEYVVKDKKLGFDTIKLAKISHNSFGFSDASHDSEFPVPDIRFDDDGMILDRSSDPDVGNEQTGALFRHLRMQYNIILVDAGTLNNSNGTFWLLNSDANILVIDCSRTTRESLEYQQRVFENSDISIDGSILNKRKFPIPRSLYWLVR
jgi:Mrp family chromosome partitioning ATPase